MFAPEYMWKKCPWWHKLVRKLPWFKCRCAHINFLGVQLPVILASLPPLVLGDIAAVQALDQRTAEVFYLDVKYGTASRGETDKI